MKKFCSLIGLMLLLSCSSNKEKEHVVFIYNQPNPITSLDPAFAKSQNNIWAINHLFDGLVTLDDSLNIVPAIAKSWEINNEFTKLIFHLRNDVYFHENKCFGQRRTRKVVASDVEYSLNRLIDPKVNSPGSWLFSDKQGEQPLFEVENDSTFIINLKQSFSPILKILTMQYCSIVPKEAIDFYQEDFRKKPVGTGPYQFKRWVEDQALFLKRNERYLIHPLSNIEFVKTTFIPDKQIAMFELLNGKIDFISGIESSYVNDLLDREGRLLPSLADKISYKKAPFLNMEYLGINMKDADGSILLDKNFRKAINYAVDKELMLKSLRNDVGTAANSGFIPAGLPSYNPKLKGYPYNHDLAVKFLRQSKYTGEEIIISTNTEYLDICTFVAKQWETIGIKVKIEVLESAILRDGMRKSMVPFFRGSWIADYPDGESFLCMFYSKNPAPPNYTRFENEAFDSLYETALKTSIETEKIELYQQMNEIIIEEAPVVFLFYDESTVFYDQSITNYQNNGLNLLNINFNIEQ